jgi:phosphoglycerol transferase MdoB-like AlkP superfamily enzyme
LQTLPNLLKEKGYSSTFYHGGTNGTMNFNAFAPLAGYDNYYGRSEYNNDEDYDGQWGIWDEPFLVKASQNMSTLKQPFFTSIFTLSSHNPYKVPEKYNGKFPKGTLEIHECVGYADYALKQFFKEAKKQPWFNNTLFVITADHTAESADPFYSNLIGQYNVPIILYKNGITAKQESRTVQQIDIMPTILDYINYDQPYYSFGKSMLADSKQPAIYYNSPVFYCVQDSIFYIINDHQFVEAYNYQKDSLLKNNILDKNKTKDLLNYCNAYIQTYTNDVINNKTYYDNKKQN